MITHPPASASQVSRHPTPGERPHPRSTLDHPTSLALTHRRPLDQSTHRARVILGPWSARPKRAPTTALFPAVAQNEDKATVKMILKLALPPSSQYCSLLSQPLLLPTVSRGRLSSYPFLLHSHVPLPLYTGPPAIPAQLSPFAATSPFISFTS
jgi:hypothetical protein